MIKFNDDNFIKKMQGIAKEVKTNGTSEVAKEALKERFKEAQKLVPQDSGKLHQSGSVVDGRKGEAAIIYEEPYAMKVEFKDKAFLRPAMMRSKVRNSLTNSAKKVLNKIIKNNT